MSTVSNTDRPSENERPERRVWYYLAMGVVAGAAVIAFAVLPQQFAGLALVVAAVLIGLIDVLGRRFSVSRFSTHLGKRTIIYLVVVGVVMISAVVLVWTLVRNGDALWLAWVMAGLFFVVVVLGTWIVDEHPTHQTASAT